jgi:hypothetical protein
MPNYFGALTLVLMIGIVSTRVFLLRQQGVEAMKFGQIDKGTISSPRSPFFISISYSLLRSTGPQ